jgi:hypothetical protein
LTRTSNDDLAKQLGSDLSRLRRVYSAGREVSQPQRVEAPRELIKSNGHALGETPPLTVVNLSEMERRGLFVALSAGTERNLGRQPTVTEFVRLSDAVVLARQLVTLEQGLFCGGVEVHWTGDEWIVQPVETPAANA